MRTLVAWRRGVNSGVSTGAPVGITDNVGNNATRSARDIAATTLRICWEGWFASSLHSRTIRLLYVDARDTATSKAMSTTMNTDANTIGRPPGLTRD